MGPVALNISNSKDFIISQIGIMSHVEGYYDLETSENFEEFMKALGVGMVMRKLANNAKPAVEFRKDGENYSFKTISSVKTTELKFKLDTPFDDTSMDGREVTTTFNLDGNKLTMTQKGKKGVDATYVREFTENGLTLTATCNGVTSKRTYKELKPNTLNHEKLL